MGNQQLLPFGSCKWKLAVFCIFFYARRKTFYLDLTENLPKYLSNIRRFISFTNISPFKVKTGSMDLYINKNIPKTGICERYSV